MCFIIGKLFKFDRNYMQKNYWYISLTSCDHHQCWNNALFLLFLLLLLLFFILTVCFHLLGTVYYFLFSASLPIMVDIPTACRRNPRHQERKGQRLPRDPCDRNRTKHATICYHTRCIQSLSFVAFDNSISISSIRGISSSLNLCFFVASSSRVREKANGEHV